jgi:uncharacterized membrane protein YphA (DoxX/SURF4 family)
MTSTNRLPYAQTVILLVLRIAVGWHLAYEGLAKILIPDWTSAPYLLTARGPFAALFHLMAAAPLILRAVDLVNMYGLLAIGLALMLGWRTRLAAGLGIFFILAYYVAHPPLISTDIRVPVEGHYLFVNKNLIEMLALGLLLVFPVRLLPGLDNLFSHMRRTKEQPTPEHVTAPAGTESYGLPAARPLTRRHVMTSLTAVPFLGVLGYGAARKYRWEKNHAITGATIKLPETRLGDLKGELPKGMLGELPVSRLILGCNLIGGWAHARDLIYAPTLFRAYNTDRKVFETIELAEKAGISLMAITSSQLPLFHKYLQIFGGKMQTMCQCCPRVDDLKTDIDKAIDGGCTTMYVQGAHAERFVKAGRIDLLGKALEYMKSQGYVSGIGAHSIEVPIACEREGLDPDYYVKTLHHDGYWSAHPRENRVEWTVDGKNSPNHDEYHDNMFDLFPERTIEFMKQVNKPFIAFKVLAGGAIHPRDGFRFAFENGADFICVGMFDFQVVEDVNIAIDTLAQLERERNWMS